MDEAMDVALWDLQALDLFGHALLLDKLVIMCIIFLML
jgi:hypothetical protein